jgi:cytochrome P450
MFLPSRTAAPPGPRGTFLGGNLADFRRDRLDFLTQTARSYGDVAALRLGPHRIFLVSHPDLIEEVLVTQSRHFSKHFALRLNPLVLGKGLLTSEGDLWLRQRRLIQPAFQRSKINRYGAVMPAYTSRLIDSWSDGETRDIVPELMRLTLQIAAKILFDAEVSDEASAVGEALTLLQESFISRFNSLVPPPLWLPLPSNLRLRRAVRRLDEILYRFIRQRRQSGEDRGDLLSLLLHARDEDDRTGMTDRQLRDEAMTLFLAGHETTALALSWAWFLLASHADAAERLRQEVDAVLAGRLVAVEDMGRLRFAEAVILEAMRLYPPAYVIGREAIRDCEVGGYRVARGTTILMSQWVVHRDERFFPRPEAFQPARWLEGGQGTMPKYAYFPFGGGPRLCIGNSLAMMEAVLVLATLAQRVRFVLQPGHAVEPWPTFTLRPRKGVPVILAFQGAGL